MMGRFFVFSGGKYLAGVAMSLAKDCCFFREREGRLCPLRVEKGRLGVGIG